MQDLNLIAMMIKCNENFIVHLKYDTKNETYYMRNKIKTD